MKVDSIIRNGKIVSPAGVIQAGIAVDGGKIVAVASDTALPEAKRTIDAQGNYVIPGVIDVHTHLGAYHTLEEDMKDTIF